MTHLLDGRKMRLGAWGVVLAALLAYAKAKGWVNLGADEEALLLKIAAAVLAGGLGHKLQKLIDELRKRLS